ncbi:hypothetical protein DZS_00320 [Dickeya ananatis]
MFALGEYPAVKLSEAREKCEQARKQVAGGVNPAQACQLDKIRKVNDASNTFELITKEWLQMKDWLLGPLSYAGYTLASSSPQRGEEP